MEGFINMFPERGYMIKFDFFWIPHPQLKFKLALHVISLNLMFIIT